MSDFVDIDTMITKKLHDELYTVFARPKKGQEDLKPFQRNIDLWMLGFCIAIKEGLKPVDLKSAKTKAIEGRIFVKNHYIESIVKLILVKKFDEQILSEPRKMHKFANELSAAGIAYLKDTLAKSNDETPLVNVLDLLKDHLS